MSGNFAPANPSIFGYWRYETVAAPGAGNNWTFTNGANALRCVQSVRFMFTPAVAAGDRYLGLVLKNQGSTITMSRYTQIVLTALSAPTVWYLDINWPLTSTQDVPNRNTIYDNLPPLWLNPGDTLSSDVLGILAGDSMSSIQIGCFCYQQFAT